MTGRLARQIKAMVKGGRIGPGELARLVVAGASLVRAASAAEIERIRSRPLRIDLEEALRAPRVEEEDHGPGLPDRLRNAIREVYGMNLKRIVSRGG
jgi:hypothetical protein